MMSVIATPTPVSVKSFSIDSFVTEFLRSSTTTSPRGFGSAYAHNSTNVFGTLSANFIDSPNTTSEIYYNVCHKRSGSSSGIFDGYNMDNTLVLLEVGG